jgi:hypothetical protein
MILFCYKCCILCNCCFSSNICCRCILKDNGMMYYGNNENGTAKKPMGAIDLNQAYNVGICSLLYTAIALIIPINCCRLADLMLFQVLANQVFDGFPQQAGRCFAISMSHRIFKFIRSLLIILCMFEICVLFLDRCIYHYESYCLHRYT